MKTKDQAVAGAILAAALGAGMLYVQPVKAEIPIGFRCTFCKETGLHKPECLPPYGLIKVPEVPA